MQKKLYCVAAKYTKNYQQLLKIKKFIYVVIFSLILATASYADIRQVGQNSYEAGVNSIEMSFKAAPETFGIQRQDQWCWAASIQMILNYHGLYVTQEKVVQMIKGDLRNEGGTHEEIIYALNGWGIDYQGRPSTVRAFTDNSLTPAGLINILAYKYPMIAELNNSDGSGHAVVLTAVGFHYVAVWNGYAYANVPVLDYAIYRDPWGRDGKPSRQTEYWSSFGSRVRNLDQVFVAKY